MASANAASPTLSGDPVSGLGRDHGERREDHELLQYHRILQLHDAILAGTHPTIKLPKARIAELAELELSSLAGGQQISSQYEKNFSRSRPHDDESATILNDASTSRTATAPQTTSSTRPQINPIFLEKSDNLVKAEFKIQRQRLERALKEELDHRRSTKQPQAEPMLGDDLSAILAKALARVQADSARMPAADDIMRANQDTSSDSFDDNTFYSSRHETPENVLVARLPELSIDSAEHVTVNNTVVPLVSAITDDRRQREHVHLSQPIDRPATQLPGIPCAPAPVAITSSQFSVPGLNNYARDLDTASKASIHNTAVPVRTYHETEAPGPQQPDQAERTQRPVPLPITDAYVDAHPPSPMVRTHDLHPTAPQPNHIPALGLNVDHLLPPDAHNGPVGAPAQVAALRTDPTTTTSSESSSRSGKGLSKKERKKKRKADRQAQGNGPVVHVKSEPGSPSQLAAPPFLRPSKRQKQAQRWLQQGAQDEDGYEPPPAVDPVEYNPAYPLEEGRGPSRYVSAPGIQPQMVGMREGGEPQFERSRYMRERGAEVGPEYYPVSVPSPAQSGQYIGNGQTRQATGFHAIVDEAYREPGQFYHEPYEPTRPVLAPRYQSYHGAPQVTTRRVVLDAFGREYLEPQHYAAEQGRFMSRPEGDRGLVYDGVPDERPESRQLVAPHRYEGEILYAGPAQPQALPRRFFSRPEYVPTNGQEYWQTEPRGSMSAMDPAHLVPLPDRRMAIDGNREYIRRAASVHPAGAKHFGSAREYQRVQSVRPEGPIRGYPSEQHVHVPHEAAQPYVRPTEGRGGAMTTVRPEFSTAPMGRYYQQLPYSGGSEVAIIDGSQGAPREIVYR